MDSSGDNTKLKTEKSTLLHHQCLPISAMTVLEDDLLVLGEGPCILVLKSDHEKHTLQEKFVKHQLFPNQLTVTGIQWMKENVKKACRSRRQVVGSQSPAATGEKEKQVGFVWAGNHGALVTLDRLSLQVPKEQTFPHNYAAGDTSWTFNYIPIAARWFNEGKTLAVLSVFNYVVVYERTREDFVGKGLTMLKGLKELAKYECEQENLYSGTMVGDTLEDLLVFSGTTFQGILVWNIKDGRVCVRHKLMGHKGIPFSLEYDTRYKRLVSASDDRSVIVWKFSGGDSKGDEQNGTNLTGDEIVRISHKFTGHEARVWKATCVEVDGLEYVLSVGEDSSVRIHGLDNTFTKTWKAHDGASIYHCAYSKKKAVLYTAAHDGSVFQWKRFCQQTESAVVPIDNVPRHLTIDGMFAVNAHGRSILNKDYPRSISLWNRELIVASMDSGRIIGFHLKTSQQFNLYDDVRLKRYSVIDKCDRNGVIIIGGLAGDLIGLKFNEQFLLGLKNNTALPENAAINVWTDNVSSKVLNIICLNCGESSFVLVVCLDRAHVYQMTSTGNQIRMILVKAFDLSLERPGLPAACLKEDILILGDETGNLSTVSLDSNVKSYIQLIKDAHQEGVTSIVQHCGSIMTAGRYGGVKSFRLEGRGLDARLLQIHEFIPPFEWVGKLLPIRDRDLLLIGFQKGDLVMYSWRDKRIVTDIVSVGGGHRRWDAKFSDGIITFSYIRDKEIYFSTVNLDDCIDSILKTGLHCKTINCGVELMTNSKGTFIATGSEDGTIRVFQYDPALQCHHPTHQINNHASSVRTLASMNIDEHKALLFSAGGRSEVLVFQIGLDVEELTQCGRIALIKSRNREAEIDMRIMDLKLVSTEQTCVICLCACSDGIVRILRYSLDHKRFVIISLLQGNNHCITKLQVIPNPESLLIFGATTNGNILVWSWKPPQLNQKLEFIKNPENVESSFSFKARNAAIMSFKMIPSREPQSYYFVLGSDDSSVSCWMIKIPKDIHQLSCSNVNEIFHEDQSQRGAVVGVDIVINENNSVTIYSCSNDQIICKLDGTNGTVLRKTFTGVSDCQGFIVNSNKQFVTCFGNGISWIKAP